MNTMERLFISGFGALIPILAILYTKGIVAETDGIAMKAAIAVAIGCFFGYLRKDETDRWVLLQVGLAVPALLTSMVANSTANQQKNEKEALQQILKPSSAPVPSVPGSTGPAARLLWQDLLTLPSVHAQNDDKKVYVPSQPNVLQVLGITTRSDWYVLAACHLSSNSAAEHATAARSAHPHLAIYPPSQGNPYHCLTLGENLSFEDAKTLAANSAKTFPNAYAWKIGLPLRPPQAACAAVTLKQRQPADLSAALGETTFLYAGDISRRSPTFLFAAVFPPSPTRAFSNSLKDSDFLNASKNMPRELKTFPSRKETVEQVLPLVHNFSNHGRQYRATLTKLDFRSIGNDSASIHFCRLT
jgi:hypothetical protein